MWDIDLTYQKGFINTFGRLYEKLELLNKSRPLPQAALNKIKEALTVEWTYNSNSIEGNTLSLRETQLVLQEGITIKGKSLREHFEAKNHEKAIELLYGFVSEGKPLSTSMFLWLHAMVLRAIEDDFAGRLRNGGVRIAGANFIPPYALKVPNLLEELVNFVNENPLQLNDIEMAAVFHHKFVWIHPFFDGNGRTVRLAMNLILMGSGFPPAIILKNDRKKYYDALNLANNGNYEKLMLLVCQAVERTLNIYLGVLPNQTEGYEPIQNIVEEPGFPYSQEYISLLARQGKIDAHKEGRNWVTTKSAIANYIENRQRKR